MSYKTLCCLALGLVLTTVSGPAQGAEDNLAQPKNTQAEDIRFLPPEEARASIKLPKGFHASLFAHEPQIRQPIALTFDGRGRLWVAENYTYAERPTNHDLSQHDRIVILTDRDGDGRADERKVFWDRAQRLTSVEVGFGGVWALCPPQLLFIPDRDGDDLPDGEPQVVLDGWDGDASRHNFVNGLKWGPDGWLYGRNGILVTAQVGPPGAAPEDRTAINCGIWRYHPTRKKFEVVCTGTTNPWGHDWDQNGQLFFINTVIGHLWHVVPGAHYRRMYGEPLNPNLYELIEQTADHFHWDAAHEDWTALRTKPATSATDQAGGGHAHSGMMIYQGNNWPKEYRGELFTLNLHGRRVNQDHLQREGATYVGKHRPDFMTVGDPWFRGIDLAYGPDGGVYILDWSDIGECHENDGIHRTSGRIYKVTYGDRGAAAAKLPDTLNMAQASNAELVRLQQHENEWFVRQARRVLQERAASGDDLTDARQALLRLVNDQATSVPHRLRALWSLHVMGAADEALLLRQLDDPSEHVRTWAVQLLVDGGAPSPAVVKELQQLADREQSGLVLTFLASTLQRLAPADRWPIARSLVRHEEFADDRVLPLVVWYGLESAVLTDPKSAAAVIGESRMPKVSRFIARRLTAEIEHNPAAVDALVEQLAASKDDATTQAILVGMNDALRGWLKAPRPAGWEPVAARLEKQTSGETRQLVQELSLVFGSGRAVDQLRSIAADKNQPAEARRQAIRSLAAARTPDLAPLLRKLLGDNDVAEEAARGLSAANPPDLSTALLAAYPRLREAGKLAIVEALAARPETAAALLAAVDQDKVAREHVQPFVVRQMQLLGSADVQQKIEQLWPELKLISGDKLAQIAAYQKELAGDSLASADAARGRKLFEQSCAKCHKLFGRGESIGPELTGAQRTNLNYWLENIVDPSAQVAANFRMSIVLVDDGRVLNGVALQQTDRTLTLQTPTERLVLDRRNIEAIRPSQLSLMPEGLLNQLSDQQRRDLFAYLMAPRDPVAGVGHTDASHAGKPMSQ